MVRVRALTLALTLILALTQQAQAAQGEKRTLPEIVRQIIKSEGVAGLYRGCNAQIGTAVLESNPNLTLTPNPNPHPHPHPNLTQPEPEP